MQRTIAIALTFAMSLGALACDKEEVDTRPDLGPPVEVNLPPIPELNLDRPVRFEDGSLSLWGLLQRRDELLESQVSVTAMVREIYVCLGRIQQDASDRLVRWRYYLTDEETDVLMATIGSGEGTGADGVRCRYPHMYVADTMESDRWMLITGYPAAIEQLILDDCQPDPECSDCVCSQPAQLLLEGRFLEETRGFNDTGGVIFVHSVKNDEGISLEELGSGLGADAGLE